MTLSSDVRRLEIWTCSAQQVQYLAEPTLFISCLGLPNPHGHVKAAENGKSKRVQKLILKHLKKETIDKLVDIVKTYGVVGFYCNGGKHRSVAVGEIVGEKLRQQGEQVYVHHMSPKMWQIEEGNDDKQKRSS